MMRSLPIPALALALLGGCLRTTSFTCTDDTACGANGRCEMTGYCSAPDSSCPGNRYGASAGPLAGECVGDGSGGSGSGMADAPAMMMPDASQCPPDFVTLPMLDGPQHHVYKMLGANDFFTQLGICAGIDHTYLAFPRNLAELMALAAALAPPQWIGIHRIGSTFWNSKNSLADYTAWPAGGPLGGDHDCAELTSTTEMQTENCNMPRPALCECEP